MLLNPYSFFYFFILNAMRLFIIFLFSLCISVCSMWINFSFATKLPTVDSVTIFLEKIDTEINWNRVDAQKVSSKLLDKYLSSSSIMEKNYYQLIISYLYNNHKEYNDFLSDVYITLADIARHVTIMSSWYYLEQNKDISYIFSYYDNIDCKNNWVYGLIKNDYSFFMKSTRHEVEVGHQKVAYTYSNHWNEVIINRGPSYKNLFVFADDIFFCKQKSWNYAIKLWYYTKKDPKILATLLKQWMKNKNYQQVEEIIKLMYQYNMRLFEYVEKIFYVKPWKQWILIFSRGQDRWALLSYQIIYLLEKDNKTITLQDWLYTNFVWSDGYGSDEWFMLSDQEPELSKECDEAMRKAYHEGRWSFISEDSVCHQKVLETFTAMLEKDTTATSIFEKKIKRFLQEIEKIETKDFVESMDYNSMSL